MSTGGETKYTFTADTSSLQAAMKQADAALASTTSQAVASGAKIDAAMTGASVATEKMGTNATRALKALGPLGGVLSRISPEAGAVASSIAGVTSGLEGLSIAGVAVESVAVTLGGALAALGIVYVELTGVIGDYTAAEKEAERAAVAHKAALTPLADAIAAERKERDMLLEALNSTAPAEALAVAERQLKIDQMEMAATADLRKEREDLVKVVEAVGVARNTESLKAEERIKEIDEEIAAVHAQGVELNALQGQTEEIRTVAQSYTGALVVQKEATEAAASADAAWAKVLAEGVLYNLEVNAKAAEKRAKAEKENAEIIAKADEEAAMRALEAEETLRQRRIEMEAERTAQYEQGLQDRADLDQEYRDYAVDLATSTADLLTTIAQIEADRRADIVDRLQTRLTEGEDTLTTRQKQALRQRIRDAKDAAREAYRVTQALAIVQATISAAAAVVNALATVPYPAAIAVAAAAAVTGAASIATIAAQKPPTFHTGGVFSTDEGMAKLRNGEGVLTPETTRALGGAAGIAEMNRRQGLAGGGTVLRIGRREVSEMERMGVRAGGPRNRQIRNEVRRGSIIAGRSGKGVLA